LTQPVHGEEDRVLFPKSLLFADKLSTEQLPACPVGLKKAAIRPAGCLPLYDFQGFS
jgi:hypothetical protein